MIDKWHLRIAFAPVLLPLLLSCSSSETTEPEAEVWLEPKPSWNYYYSQAYYDSLFLDEVYTSVRQAKVRVMVRTGDTLVDGGEKAIKLQHVEGFGGEPEGVVENVQTLGYFRQAETEVYFTDLCSDSVFQAENYFGACFQSHLTCVPGDERLYFTSAGRAGKNWPYRDDEQGLWIEKSHSVVSETIVLGTRYEAMRISWKFAPRSSCGRESDYFCAEYFSRDALVARRQRWTEVSDSIIYEHDEPVDTIRVMMRYNRVLELVDMKAVE
jgi:hypothetical protein